MTNEIVNKMICRKCGKESAVVAWPILDAQKMPHIKREILDWEFFFSTCPDCGAKTDFFYTASYIDRQDKVLLRTFTGPLPISEDIPFPMPPPVTFTFRQYVFRDVVGWREMREKLLIFSLGMNDFQIELAKYIIQMQYHVFNLEFVSAGRDKWVFRNCTGGLSRPEYITFDPRDYQKALDLLDHDYLYLKTYLHVDIFLVEQVIQSMLH